MQLARFGLPAWQLQANAAHALRTQTASWAMLQPHLACQCGTELTLLPLGPFWASHQACSTAVALSCLSKLSLSVVTRACARQLQLHILRSISWSIKSNADRRHRLSVMALFVNMATAQRHSHDSGEPGAAHSETRGRSALAPVRACACCIINIRMDRTLVWHDRTLMVRCSPPRMTRQLCMKCHE
jgi:hypothetical protein